jgi:phage terminase Nu1 subunit (DNA packaging protein)
MRSENLEMDFQKTIESILSVGVWKFDGLPEQITSKFDELINQYHIDHILTAMISLAPKFEREERLADECKGNSGIAGEMHVAAAMRLKYLNESMEYIRSKTDNIT